MYSLYIETTSGKSYEIGFFTEEERNSFLDYAKGVINNRINTTAVVEVEAHGFVYIFNKASIERIVYRSKED